ncbi:hypothetical protein ACW0US_17775 [Xanthomonas euvesicatoria]
MSDGTDATGKQRFGLLRKAGRAYRYTIVGDLGGDVQALKSRWNDLRALMARRSTSRAETFGEAVKRLGITDADLEARDKSLRLQFYVYVSVSALSFVMLLAAPFVAHPLSQFTMSLGVFLVCGCRSAICRFRRHQIESRELVSFREWIEGARS